MIWFLFFSFWFKCCIIWIMVSIFFGYVVVYFINEWNIVLYFLFWMCKLVLNFKRILIMLVFFDRVVIVKGSCFIIIVFMNWDFVVWMCSKVDIWIFLFWLIFSIVWIVFMLFLVMVIWRVVWLWNFIDCFFVMRSRLGYNFDNFVMRFLLFWFLIVKCSRVLFCCLGFWYICN